jgi:hypothetical protein
MKIKRILESAILVSVLSIGAFGQTAVSGRITGIAVDPSDSSQSGGNTIYVSTTGGGVWTVITTMTLFVI